MKKKQINAPGFSSPGISSRPTSARFDSGIRYLYNRISSRTINGFLLKKKREDNRIRILHLNYSMKLNVDYTRKIIVDFCNDNIVSIDSKTIVSIRKQESKKSVENRTHDVASSSFLSASIFFFKRNLCYIDKIDFG